ncbi:hypothetical protein [Neoroseomonas soli]|uniref:Uncharacterized protein n=1 Tax=Neoroseomonas soli TaxID=1081025 RepID=A0A9X9X0I2_9PROT|nr:hypothetical protein [Neoroseomonas soli]MBR0672911.1 hypothetical protein [Neoroseomonas soli]
MSFPYLRPTPTPLGREIADRMLADIVRETGRLPVFSPMSDRLRRHCGGWGLCQFDGADWPQVDWRKWATRTFDTYPDAEPDDMRHAFYRLRGAADQWAEEIPPIGGKTYDLSGGINGALSCVRYFQSGRVTALRPGEAGGLSLTDLFRDYVGWATAWGHGTALRPDFTRSLNHYRPSWRGAPLRPVRWAPGIEPHTAPPPPRHTFRKPRQWRREEIAILALAAARKRAALGDLA